MLDWTWAAAAVLTAAAGLTTVVVTRGLTARRRRYLFPTSQLSAADLSDADLRGAEDRLAAGLRFPTVSVSREDPPPRDELLKYHQHLRDSFPAVFSSDVVTVETVNELSLLLTVSGSDASLSPYLLLSHMDVVPAAEENWRWPPFGGLIENGEIIGRGAVDVKQTTHAILESLEHRLKTGDRPTRSLYVCLGHDEEVNGTNGAKKIAEVLKQRGVKPLFLIDEGLTVLSGFFPGVKGPMAVVGVAEKGYLALELTARGEAGHSSMPPQETAVGRLAHAVARLHPNPQPVLFGRGPEVELLRVVGSAASPLFRIVYANVWLFGALIKRALLSNKAMRATIQTSTAVTVIRGGYKENVIPGEASAVVNHRVSPVEDRDAVVACDRRAISDPGVELKVLYGAAASPISPYDEADAPFSLLAGTIQQLYGEAALTAPSLMIANTDTRHYLELCDHVYRFNPILLRPDQLGMYHGDDERLGVDNYHNCVRFYYRLMKNAESEAVVAKMR